VCHWIWQLSRRMATIQSSVSRLDRRKVQILDVPKSCFLNKIEYIQNEVY
jgi:hypothetical protein